MKQAKPKNILAAMNAAGHIHKFLVAIATSLSLSVLAHAAAAPVPLDGDGWMVAPQAEVSGSGEQISSPGFPTDKWVKAKVPGTVLEAYVVAGIEKEPSYGDNAYKVDKKKYDRNFWYRTEFQTPATFATGRTWLEFDGVNKSADVYLNGKKLGSMHGFVQRAKFEVTGLLRQGADNSLAVLDYFPGETDKRTVNTTSPSFICSTGWDWMPTVAGYNMGIHRSVRLTSSDMSAMAVSPLANSARVDDPQCCEPGMSAVPQPRLKITRSEPKKPNGQHDFRF
jgi:hypothetical protein